jgi:hypothetical protein
MATAAIFVTLALYRLFQGVSRSQAALLVILGGPMPAAVYFCNALNDVAALMFAPLLRSRLHPFFNSPLSGRNGPVDRRK